MEPPRVTNVVDPLNQCTLTPIGNFGMGIKLSFGEMDLVN